MSHLEIDAARIAAGKLTDFAVGTLVMVPTKTQSASGPFWALRFDENSDEGVKRSVIWLNGVPWHGADPAFYGMPLDDTDMQGIGCGLARIRVDVTSGAGRQAGEMRWDQSAGHIAVSLNGTFLVGQRSRREVMWGAHYAIDISAWAEAPYESRHAPVDWFSRWSVVIETTGGDIALPFDARSKVAALAA